METQPQSFTQSGARILVVEDDNDIAVLLRLRLTELGHQVLVIRDGTEALNFVSSVGIRSYDLVVLDLMLPGTDGYTICKNLRDLYPECGILMLTAKHLFEDKIFGFDVGADDYLTKPFDVLEFEARVRAILRRISLSSASAASSLPTELRFGNLVLDMARKEARLGADLVKLSPTEYRLLEFFASHPGKAFTREDLLIQVWGYSASGYENTVNTTVNRLRIKIEADQENPIYVRTVRGYGYRFVAQDEIGFQV